MTLTRNHPQKKLRVDNVVYELHKYKRNRLTQVFKFLFQEENKISAMYVLLHLLFIIPLSTITFLPRAAVVRNVNKSIFAPMNK